MTKDMSNNKTKIILSLIGFLGIVVPLLITNWGELFPSKQEQESTIQSSPEIPPDIIKKDKILETTTIDKKINSDQNDTGNKTKNIDPQFDNNLEENNILVDNNYFQYINSEISEPENIKFESNTAKIGYSKKPHKLFFIKYADIDIKIGIVQINEINKSAIIKLTKSTEHFDNSDGKIVNNWNLGDTKVFENEGRILKIKFTDLKKSGRGYAFFNIESWEN